MDKKVTFIPATLPAVLQQVKNIPELNWVYGQTPNYPHLLFSVYFARKYQDIRKYFNVKNATIYGDSGGFQNMTLGANLNALDVLRWQEKNCDVGFTFDYPISEKDPLSTAKDKQIKTVEKAYYALDKKTTNMKLYASCQGHSLSELQFLLDRYKEMGDIKKFNGVAIGGLVPLSANTNKILDIALPFVSLFQKYHDNFHFFGISNEKINILLYYIANQFNININFDSSSFDEGRKRASFYNKGKKIQYSVRPKKLPCKCKSCNLYNSKNFDIKYVHFLATHNLYQIIERNKKINSFTKEHIKRLPEYKNYIEKIDRVKNGEMSIIKQKERIFQSSLFKY